VFARHGVLTAGTVTEVVVPASAAPMRPRIARLEVVNRNAAGELWFTTDGSDPTVQGDNVNVIPAVMGSYVIDGWSGRDFSIRLMSAVAVAWSVQVG